MSKRSLVLTGRIDDEAYQKSFECFEFLRADRPAEFDFKVLEMMPVQWEAHLQKLQEQFGADKLDSSTRCVVYTEDSSELWCGAAFAEHMCATTNFKLFPFAADSEDPEAYGNQAKARYRRFLAGTGHTFCYFDISIDNEKMDQRVVFELFTDLCPRTCENFRHLCLGDCPDVTGVYDHPVRLHYKGTGFFRIVPGGWLQGGDLVHNQGSGGHSIYGPEFPDECFTMKHDAEGVLGMANNGKNTNASQFYVTVARNSWMDGKYVAFGRVVEGMSVIRHIHNMKTKHNQMPELAILIEDCGEINLAAP